MQDAIKNVNLNAVLIARIRQIYSDCDGLVGNPLKSCFEEKAQEAQAIVDSTQTGFPGFDASGAIGFINNISLDILGLISPTARVGAELGNAAVQGVATNGIEGAYTSVLQTTALPIIPSLCRSMGGGESLRSRSDFNSVVRPNCPGVVADADRRTHDLRLACRLHRHHGISTGLQPTHRSSGIHDCQHGRSRRNDQRHRISVICRHRRTLDCL
jgi:hypothetical protein